uniref:GRAM domain-containing protein n=1 Tax=Heterorhabditis bacteriophora TaxID=37862 RepID=A0A1I7WND6_HETBA
MSSITMKGPVPRNTTGSPKPLILRQHNGYKGSELESTSISSTDTVSDVETESSWEAIKKEIRWFLLDIVEALESPRNNGTESTHDTGKLSAVALKKDLKRCCWCFQIVYLVPTFLYSSDFSHHVNIVVISDNFLHPFLEVAAALYDTLLWKTPINTLLLALVRAETPFRLRTLNRTPRHLHIFSLLTWKEVRVTIVFYCLIIYWLTLSLIFNTGTCLGMCGKYKANIREVIDQISSTEGKYNYVSSKKKQFMLFQGITLGVRIFITTYLFDRFPRLRYRLDTFGWFYRNLPIKNTAPSSHSSLNGVNIDGINSDRSLTPSSGHRNPGVISGLFSSRLGSNFDLDQGSMQNLHTLSNKAHSASNLPLLSEESNAHLPGVGPSFVNLSSYSGEDEEYEDSSAEDDPMIDNVVAFRSCVMNDKAKMFPKGITSGILYLTDSALIFRSRSANEDTASVMLLFTDIISTKKIQSLRSMSIIAGTRKSLEITISGRRKPVQFIGIAKRDDFVQRMESMCVQAQAKVYFID